MDLFPKSRTQQKIKTRTGLDVGTRTMKVLGISTFGDTQRLVGFAIRTAQEGKKEPLDIAIKRLVEDSKMTVKELNVSISGPSCIVRFVSMPRMKEEEIRGAIRFEAEKFIPFNVNDCIIDFQILKKDERENKIDIILVAVKKEHVEERIDAVEKAGFSVNIVDVDGFALANSFVKNIPSVGQEKTLALLNVGAKFTNLSMMTQGRICFVRDVTIGSDDLTEAMSKSLGVDRSSAENMKVTSKEKLEEILVCTKPVLSSLLDEVKLSFSYNENQCGRSVDEIYLSGGGSYLLGLDELIQDTFGLGPPHHWNPLGFLDISSAGIDKSAIDKTQSSLAIVVGLALR